LSYESKATEQYLSSTCHIFAVHSWRTLWCAVRIVVPTGSGLAASQRLGAVGYASGKVVSEINTGAVSSNEVSNLLGGIRRRCRQPVTVVLDNAHYQRTQAVRDEAQRLAIELCTCLTLVT
jgi:hypothetical protein